MAHLPWVTHKMTPSKYIQIHKTKNLLDKDVRIKRAHGFADSILENTERVLRLPLQPTSEVIRWRKASMKERQRS